MKFFKRHIVLSVVTLLLVTGGCVDSRKVTYFNDINYKDTIDASVITPSLVIAVGDILQVTATTIDREVSLMLNPMSTINNQAANSNVAQGYLVDNQGYIELPLAGKIYVKGKTTSQINDVIKAELSKTIKNVFVSTRLLNFRVSVLGDVARPGSFNIANERISVLDALSMAGDLNITAKRDDVLLIREEEGRKRYVSLNLNNSKLLSSPYYYLENNDVLYVKPGSNRVLASSTGFQLLPAVLGALSLITVIVTTLVR